MIIALAGVGEQEAVDPVSAAKSTVFINDVAFEVAAGPFNVREAFGDEAVLIHSSGLPVLTNDWGLTLHSLQHGAFYYLVSFSFFYFLFFFCEGEVSNKVIQWETVCIHNSGTNPSRLTMQNSSTF